MKKQIPIILLTLLMNVVVFGQEKKDLPHSVINIISSNIHPICVSNVKLSNQPEFTLSYSSIVKYIVYSEGEIGITIDRYCGVSSSSKQLTIEVKRGNEYYLLYSARDFKQTELSEVQKSMDKKSNNIIKYQEDLQIPINKASIKDIVKKEEKGQGTCFLINDDGYLITNYHCVGNSKEITVRGIDGDFTTKYRAVLIASDPSNDLALIKINNKNIQFSIPPFSIRSSGVEQAEKVYAFGFPKVETMGEEMKITEGIISAKSGVHGDISKYQISAGVNPGNSGGPLIDELGNLIGVIYAKSTIADAAGYAVKASYLETFLKNIDGFSFPTLTNSISEKSLPEKVTLLKEFIFIVETN